MEKSLTIRFKAVFCSSESVFLSIALRSSEYLVSLCIGLTNRSIRRNLSQSLCVSHHCLNEWFFLINF